MPTIPLLNAPDNIPSAQLSGNVRPTMQRPATVSPTLTSPVRANPDMYSGQFAALGRVGEGVASWGDLGFRVKAAQDYAAVTKANTFMQAAYQQFQTELEDPTNPENGDTSTWLPRWQERMGQLKEAMGEDPAIKGLSAAAKLKLDTQTSDWEKLSATQLGHQVTVRKLEDAKGTVEADYNAKLRTGDLEGAIKTVQDAVPYGIVHPAQAQQMIAGAQRKAEHYQATALILQDPIAAEGAIEAKNKDGSPVYFQHLDDDSRLQLTFEAHRRAVALKQETASELFERAQAGNPASADEVNNLVSQGRLTPAQAKQYLKPPKPEFDPTKFAGLLTDIAAYDPKQDGDRSKYAALMARAAYDPDVKGQAASDAVELLKKKSDPKSPLNGPAGKAATKTIEDAFTQQFLGKWQNKVANPNAMKPGEPAMVTVKNENVWQRAKQRQAELTSALDSWLDQHPNATPAEATDFVFKQMQPYQQATRAQMFRLPSNTPTAPKK